MLTFSPYQTRFEDIAQGMVEGLDLWFNGVPPTAEFSYRPAGDGEGRGYVIECVLFPNKVHADCQGEWMARVRGFCAGYRVCKGDQRHRYIHPKPPKD